MSRKTGRNKRIQLYDRGNRACPLCMAGFTRDQASAGRSVTLEHVPPKSLGGQARCLTCRPCNARAGDTIDQVAAMTKRVRFSSYGRHPWQARHLHADAGRYAPHAAFRRIL